MVVEVLGAEQLGIEEHNFIPVTLHIIPFYIEYDHVMIFTKEGLHPLCPKDSLSEKLRKMWKFVSQCSDSVSYELPYPLTNEYADSRYYFN